MYRRTVICSCFFNEHPRLPSGCNVPATSVALAPLTALSFIQLFLKLFQQTNRREAFSLQAGVEFFIARPEYSVAFYR